MEVCVLRLLGCRGSAGLRERRSKEGAAGCKTVLRALPPALQQRLRREAEIRVQRASDGVQMS